MDIVRVSVRFVLCSVRLQLQLEVGLFFSMPVSIRFMVWLMITLG